MEYSIRSSGRAKRARIEVTVNGQVNVVIPQSFDPALIPSLVAHHKPWIEKTLKKTSPNQPQQPPTDCIFHALNEHWEIHYDKASPIDQLEANHKCKTLILHPESQTTLLLTQWLHDYARRTLTQRLQQKSFIADLL